MKIVFHLTITLPVEIRQDIFWQNLLITMNIDQDTPPLHDAPLVPHFEPQEESKSDNTDILHNIYCTTIHASE